MIRACISRRRRVSSVAATVVATVVLTGCGPATTSAPPHRAPHPVPEGAPPHGAPARELPDELRAGEHYAVYRADGTRASMAEVGDAMAEVDAVLVGEEHDDPVTHRLQLELLQDAFVRHHAGGERPLVLSLEMFERDVQLVLDEYLADLITEDHFLAASRPWDGYVAYYRPLVQFARAHGLPVVAANAPRRYVNRVSRLGRDSLDELPPEALEHLAPLPYPAASEAYQAEWDALMGDAADHASGSLLDGQMLWDATMGHSIARVLEEEPGALVLHLAGGFHVKNRTGTPEAVLHYRPDASVMVVTMRPAEEVGDFDPESHAGLGDFVILTDGTFQAGGR